jgi:GNAT superfamily N-acetyltransferase
MQTDGSTQMKHERRAQVRLRDLVEADCPAIARAFAEQGWNKPETQYLAYLEEAQAGKRVVLVAEVDGAFAGYVTIVWHSDYPPFRAAQIPEIVDLNVLIKQQRRGVATALLDEAEKRISQRSPQIGIGVGLTADYGPAQIVYARRGYVPDGCGISSHGQPVPPGATVVVDDGLGLSLTKRCVGSEGVGVGM